MIRKHFVTCTMIFLAAIISKLFIFSAPLSKYQSVDKEEIYDRILERHEKEKFYASLNFANEAIPVEEKRVKARIDRSIKRMSYRSIRTHKIHRTADRWFDIVEPILVKHGVPADFKYIPLIESGFRSGTSVKGASGFWQFMPETARAYGLTVNSEVDERDDIYKSTVAAAKYLKALYREFGSWTLTAAAYNIGEGNLKRSINRQSESNYYRLALNKETGSYLYKLISVKEIIEHPAKYGFRPSTSGTILADMTQVDSSNRL